MDSFHVGIGFRDGFCSGGWSLLPEYISHCLHENQVVLPEYHLIFFLPENGYLKNSKGAAATLSPIVRLHVCMLAKTFYFSILSVLFLCLISYFLCRLGIRMNRRGIGACPCPAMLALTACLTNWSTNLSTRALPSTSYVLVRKHFFIQHVYRGFWSRGHFSISKVIGWWLVHCAILAIAYSRYQSRSAIDINILLQSTRMRWESDFRTCCTVHMHTYLYMYMLTAHTLADPWRQC